MQIEQRMLTALAPDARRLQADLDALADEHQGACLLRTMAARPPARDLSDVAGDDPHPGAGAAGSAPRLSPAGGPAEIEPGVPVAPGGWGLGCVASRCRQWPRTSCASVNAMTVWRAVQRLGEAAASHRALSAHHADPRTDRPVRAHAPAAMWWRSMAASWACRSARSADHARRGPPGAPPVEDGHFREVKTGVLLVRPSASRSRPIGTVCVACW